MGPSLVFIDQSGIKHITRNVFNVVTQAGTTEFIFFTASSFKWRFGELLAPEIDFPENVSYTDVHRVLADKYREWAPMGNVHRPLLNQKEVQHLWTSIRFSSLARDAKVLRSRLETGSGLRRS